MQGFASLKIVALAIKLLVDSLLIEAQLRSLVKMRNVGVL